MIKEKKETIERLVVKVPKGVADYFREVFHHGDRSKFVIRCILEHKHDQEVKKIDKELRASGKKRQKFLI
ncbi:MAG: hypothetical protein ABIH87_04125 [bacterium]